MRKSRLTYMWGGFFMGVGGVLVERGGFMMEPDVIMMKRVVNMMKQDAIMTDWGGGYDGEGEVF